MEQKILLIIVLAIALLLFIKRKIWDEPHEEIKRLEGELASKDLGKELEIQRLKKRLDQREKDYIALQDKRNGEYKQLLDRKVELTNEIKELSGLKINLDELQKKSGDNESLSEIIKSNLRAIPYMAAIMADFETYGLEKLASKLDWGSSQERLKKVKSIREIRKDAQEMLEKNKEAQYQLAYLLQLFPALQDVIDCEFSQLPPVDVKVLSEFDHSRDYLSKEEYESLSTCERNQLALDRYVESHNKTKWQIGRDYELYIGYQYERAGCKVSYSGSLLKLEDLGRDLIVHNGRKTIIVQCKYWSKDKLIHENHINQLFGTMTCYCLENNLEASTVVGVLVTNIVLSDTAKRMADYLGIKYQENRPMGQFPRIKCNIGRDEFGMQTKIYHLPFDQQYDSTVIDKPGEFMAMTVAEAEAAGFRRAFKWYGG